MMNPDAPDASDEIRIGDFFAPLYRYRHLIWHATVAITALTILAGGIRYFWQPVRWTAALEFRPIFEHASDGTYPNGLPFSSTDIVESTVLDQVYDKNHIEDYCSREEFRGAFVIEENSTDLQFLALDYQARMADTRLSVIDRDRLLSEYRARRGAIPIQYTLTWFRPYPCRTVPTDVAFKAIAEVLQTWANDADSRRGVLSARVAVLTPAIFDFGGLDNQSLLIRADLVQSALSRVIANVREVEQLPGAELVKMGPERVSFAQLRARLEDLAQVHLDPLVLMAGKGLGNEAVAWVDRSLEEAAVRQKAADDRVNAYQSALREYSGAATAPPAAAVQRPPSSSDVQTLTPQIDRTFIDRIVELSAANTSFRQELTRSLVAAKVAAVQSASAVEHYRVLQAALKRGPATTLSPGEIERRLTSITAASKEQVRQFNALYDEFSRVSLRAGPAMYRVQRPPMAQIQKFFSLRDYGLLVLLALFVTPLALALGCLVHHAVRRIAMRAAARA